MRRTMCIAPAWRSPPFTRAWRGKPACPPAAGEARTSFGVMHARVLALDWLSLDPAGHRRALFDYRDGPGAARWLAP